MSIKRLSGKTSDLSTQETQEVVAICPQMNERQQRKPVIDSTSETRKKGRRRSSDELATLTLKIWRTKSQYT